MNLLDTHKLDFLSKYHFYLEKEPKEKRTYKDNHIQLQKQPKTMRYQF